MQRRPILLEPGDFLTLFVSEADCRDVIDERVKPDVHRVIRIIRHRHAPANRRLQTAHRKILKAAANKTDYFVSSWLGSDEVRLRLKHRQQRFIVIREPKEITLLRHTIEWRIVNQTGRWIAFVLWFLILVFRFVFGARRTEPTFVVA